MSFLVLVGLGRMRKKQGRDLIGVSVRERFVLCHLELASFLLGSRITEPLFLLFRFCEVRGEGRDPIGELSPLANSFSESRLIGAPTYCGRSISTYIEACFVNMVPLMTAMKRLRSSQKIIWPILVTQSMNPYPVMIIVQSDKYDTRSTTGPIGYGIILRISLFRVRTVS